MKQISLLFILLMCTVTGTLGAADDDFNSTAVDHGSSKSMHPRLGKRLLSQGVVKNEHSNLEHPYSHTIQIPALIAAEMDDIVIDMWRAIHPGTQARLRQPEFEGKTYGHVADNRGGWKDYKFDGQFSSSRSNIVKLAEEDGPTDRVYYIVPARKQYATRVTKFGEEQLEIRSKYRQLQILHPSYDVEYAHKIRVEKDRQGHLLDAKVTEWDTWYIHKKFASQHHQDAVDYLDGLHPGAEIPWDKIRDGGLEATSQVSGSLRETQT